MQKLLKIKKVFSKNTMQVVYWLHLLFLIPKKKIRQLNCEIRSGLGFKHEYKV